MDWIESRTGGTYVSHPALSPPPLTRTAIRFAPKIRFLLTLAGLCLIGSYLAQDQALAIAALLAGTTLVALSLLIGALRFRNRRARSSLASAASTFFENDESPCFTTDSDGVITYRNRTAAERFDNRGNETLVAVLGELFASPAAVLHRMQSRAKARGSAREDLVIRRGHIRVSVHLLGDSGFFWRLEALADKTAAGRCGEGISLPMMIASRTGTILFMNEALRRLLGGRESTLDRVFTEMPVVSGTVMAISGKEGPLRGLICEIDGSAGRREIYLLPEPQSRMIEPAEWGVLDGLPVPLLKLDGDGVIVMANRRARTLLGDENAVGSRLSDQVEGLGRPVSEWLREANTGRHLGRPEVVRAVKPEDEAFLQISLGQVSEAEGSALVAVLQDATELKTLEAQFVQSQKMQAIGQLAGGVAHDFNNLLTAISGHCDLLLLRHDESDPEYPDLAQIRENSNRAAALVGQLLAFSRKQTLMPEQLDLGETLSDLTHLLNRLVGERVRLELSIDGRILPIRADKRQLEQVLMNLVVNARDAMQEGGEIAIAVRNLCLDRALLRDRATVPAGEYVEVRVTDQGAGISPDRLNKIFEPFYTTKKTGQGTGLGLSTAYGIVKQTGGFIFVDSVPGAGSCFTLYFPVSRQENRPGAKGAPAPARPPVPPAHADAATPEHSGRTGETLQATAGGDGDLPSAPALGGAQEVSGRAPIFFHGRDPDAAPEAEDGPDTIGGILEETSPADMPGRHNPVANAQTALPQPTHDPGPPDGAIVLLVEDEAPVRAFASRALRMRGFTVLEAGNAEEALRTLEDDSLEVDVFVTDVVMPGMDGPSWVSQALERRPGVKVVFVSGYAEDSLSEQQARIPNSVFLPKPFSLSELTAVVQRQVH
jgi:two-component system cell cycle sensor histidine kinase/response regulator CckA